MPKHDRVYDYDLIVIGSGAGGSVTAHIAADKGKRVAIAEAGSIGGECPNYGCLPTKALLRAARLYENAKLGKELGLRMSTLNFSYPAINKWKDLVVERTGVNKGADAYARSGIALIKGHAHFISKHELTIGTRRYSAKKFVIASGARGDVPDIEGLEETGFLNYRQALELKRLPKSLLIIGGGPIGCELAQIFSTFGSKVTMVEYAPWLLPREDKQIGALVQDVFVTKRKIDVHTGAKIVRVDKKAGKKTATMEMSGVTQTIKVDEILVATGKTPNTDLGLENAGVVYNRRGIKVDNFMRTTNPNISAVGDVVGPYMFTHTAIYQGRIAAHNLFSQKRNWVKADYRAVPRTVFLTPEVAAVGLTEREANLRKLPINVGETQIGVIGRSNTDNFDIGFVKVITVKSGVLVGASIVSPHAGEMIHELGLAIQNNLTAQDVVDTIHAFPTWSEAVRVACAKAI